MLRVVWGGPAQAEAGGRHVDMGQQGWGVEGKWEGGERRRGWAPWQAGCDCVCSWGAPQVWVPFGQDSVH